jgi:hypothetical protein
MHPKKTAALRRGNTPHPSSGRRRHKERYVKKLAAAKLSARSRPVPINPCASFLAGYQVMTPPLGLRRVRLKKSDPISIAYLVGAASCFRRESRRRRQPPTPANKPILYFSAASIKFAPRCPGQFAHAY